MMVRKEENKEGNVPFFPLSLLKQQTKQKKKSD
jgi:hypothetical protein